MSGHRADRRQSPASIMDSSDVGQVVVLPDGRRDQGGHLAVSATRRTPTVQIDVVGTPVPQGQISHSAAGHAYSTNAKRLKPWRAAIAKAVISQAADVATLDGPLAVALTVYLQRPKKHYRTGKYADVLRDDAPAWPTSHQLGDIDKHQRAIFDALAEAGLIADDSLVVHVYAEKVWADGRPAGASIHLTLAKEPQ